MSRDFISKENLAKLNLNLNAHVLCMYRGTLFPSCSLLTFLVQSSHFFPFFSVILLVLFLLDSPSLIGSSFLFFFLLHSSVLTTTICFLILSFLVSSTLIFSSAFLSGED